MYVKILEIAVAILFVLGAWWYSGQMAVEKYKAEQLIEQAFATQAEQDRYNKLAAEYETLRTQRTANARTITKEVERIIEKPSYDGDCLDDDGLQWANAAIRGGSPSVPESKVPTDSGSGEHK